MYILEAIVRAIDWLNERIGRAVAWLCVVMVLNVFIVVVLRYVFSIGWVWMQELYVWTYAIVFMVGAGYTLRYDGHVRIDLIYRGASRRYKAIVNLFGCVFLGMPLIYVLFTRSWPMIIRSWMNLEKSAEVGGLPAIYLLKSVIAVFCVLFGLQILALFLRSIVILVRDEDFDPVADGQEGGRL